MARYRKKPVEIEAIQWDGENTLEVLNFMSITEVTLTSSVALDKFEDYKEIAKQNGLRIKTLEGEMRASVGDFIIKGVKGEFYPCKPDIFEATYEMVLDINPQDLTSICLKCGIDLGKCICD